MGLVTMVLVGVMVTGSLKAGGVMVGLNAVIGLGAYLVYERVWNKVSWGRSTTNQVDAPHS